MLPKRTAWTLTDLKGVQALNPPLPPDPHLLLHLDLGHHAEDASCRSKMQAYLPFILPTR